MERTWTIYTLTDPRTNLARYIGVTFRGKARYREHLSRAATNGKTHRDCWIRNLLSAGLQPELAVVETGTGDWQAAERRWIALYRPLGNLVNHTDGGEGTPGCIPSAETRAIWSAQRKGKKYAPGRRSAMLGRNHSPDAVEKIRQAGTGRLHREAAKLKISAARKDKPLASDHRQKLSAVHRGKVLTDAHKRAIAATTMNRKPVECLETGAVFASVTEAARQLQVSESSVSQAIRKGCRCKGNHFRFTTSRPQPETISLAGC